MGIKFRDIYGVPYFLSFFLLLLLLSFELLCGLCELDLRPVPCPVFCARRSLKQHLFSSVFILFLLLLLLLFLFFLQRFSEVPC